MVELNHQFYRFIFHPIPDDITLARLYDLGFESFEEKESSLEGYLPASLYSEELKLEIEKLHPVISTDLILPQNWNAIWEASFEPIFVQQKVCIRASFHPLSQLPYDIVIDPKMAFGTGHHATTYLVIEEMMKLDLTNKSVLDFGCGSGILAILAEKFGAAEVRAIDFDIWSVENSLENAAVNECRHLKVSQNDSLSTEPGNYDLLLANITRDVLLQNITEVSRLLAAGGYGIFSGFLIQDKELMVQRLKELGYSSIQYQEKEGWCAITFSKEV
ncbi:MAG: 50S ribosomal protein L11 methyltransferase [Saprospiraceae bacterium]|nr:50S ribosomal protein L11 methyltransferase [Saprospiraceae bacterium]